MLDTDQLRSFLAIVDTGSFTRAAERVNKTQSAVSMQIRRLEEQLDRQLFAKNGRGVKLSEHGEQLIDYARQILRLEATALAAVAQKGLAGRIRFGIPDDYADVFLPEIVSRFAQRHPLVEMSVVCDTSIRLREQLARRELDLAMLTDSEARNIEVLREEPLRWVVSAHSRAHEQSPLPLALGNASCKWREAACAALERAGISYRLLLASGAYAAIGPVLKTGLAVTVLPGSAIREGDRIVDALPELPVVRFGLQAAPGDRSRETAALAEVVREALSERRSETVSRSAPVRLRA